MRTVGSLFAGIGGIDIGFQQAGFEVLWANEIDKDACKTYRQNFPEITLFEDDVRNLDASRFPKVDVITAGFPCQSFSVCGNKKGFSDSRGNLFFEITRIIDKVKPQVVFLENVANLVEHDKGRTFNTIFNELAGRGYFIRYLVADACNYGIPQHRTRTYIVAFADEKQCEAFAFPQKTKLTETLFDRIDRTRKAPDQCYLNPSSGDYKRMSDFIRDDNQIYRFSDYGIQSSKDGICFTLKANMGTWHNRVPIIKDNFGIRKITSYECLALQCFPKDFIFPDIREKSCYKQCGNTVVVPLVCKIAREINAVIRSISS